MKRISSQILSWFSVAVLIAGLILLFTWVGSINPVLSTAISDLFDIVLTFAIFALAWNTTRFSPNGYLPVLGAGFLTIVLFDSTHLLLTLQGTSVSYERAIQVNQLWVLSCLLQGFTLFIIPFFMDRPVRPYLALGFFLVVAIALMIPLLRPEMIPEFLRPRFIGNNPLLDFPALLLLILGGVHIILRRHTIDPDFTRFVLLSIGLAVATELIDLGIDSRSLPLQTAVSVHSLRATSFLLVFMAVFDAGYRKPYEFLFHDLKDQKEVLQDIFDVDPGGLAILCQDQVFRMANQAYRSLTPHPETNLIGRKFKEIWSETSSYKQHQELFERALHTQEPIYVERFALTSDINSPKFANLFFKPTTWRGGPAVLETAWEVTGLELAQQKAEAAVQAASQWAAELQALMDAVPAAVLISLDEEGKQIVGNEAAYRMLHLPPGSNLSLITDGETEKPYLSLENGKVLQDTEMPMQQVIRSGKPITGIRQELRFRDGSHVFIYGNIHPLYFDEAQSRSAIGAFLDITHIVEIEKALQDSENRFRSLIESINDLVVTFDRDLKPTSIYGKSLEQYEASENADFARMVEDIITPQSSTTYQDALQRAIQGENVVYEWEMQWGNQSIHIQTSLSPMRDENREIIGVVGIGRDITRLKQVEREIEQYTAQLERSNKELEQFAFVASHDLQEPLRKIRFFSERLNEKVKTGDELERADFLERIQAATRRMQTMIDDLLAYSRVTTKIQPFTRVELKPLVDDVLADLESRITTTKGCVEVGDLPAIDADPMQMRQLFQNLIGNALKYHQPDLPPQVKVYSQPVSSRGKVEVLVEDNGIGFDEKYLDRIFQPFERLHGRSEYEGTGMGLAICRKIVERHGGEISARSEIGKGSTFTIRLPKVQKGNRPAAENQTP